MPSESNDETVYIGEMNQSFYCSNVKEREIKQVKLIELCRGKGKIGWINKEFF